MDVQPSASLQDVRERIDALDVQIVRLPGARFAYARQAAGFKMTAAQVPALECAERVIANVRRLAVENGAPPEAVEQVYRTLIGAMIDLELALHSGSPKS